MTSFRRSKMTSFRRSKIQRVHASNQVDPQSVTGTCAACANVAESSADPAPLTPAGPETRDAVTRAQRGIGADASTRQIAQCHRPNGTDSVFQNKDYKLFETA